MHYTRLLFPALLFGLLAQIAPGQGGGKQSRQVSARLMHVNEGQIASGKNVRVPLMGPLSHPLLESTYTGSPDEVIARTKYGNVTSRDLWLWISMQDDKDKVAYLLDEYNKTRLPKDKARIKKELQGEIDDFVFVNYIIPRLQESVPATPVNALKNEVYLLPAYQAVYLETIIKPNILIEEADRQKFLQENLEQIVPQTRWRTRYIFRASHESDSADIQSGIEVDLDSLRSQIKSGQISFADAARAHSEAPSAKNGGEIPPFKQGELFFHYENAAANLKPGEISETFRGPGGFYMVQLIEVLEPEEASLSNPKQAQKVDEKLVPKVVKNAFRMEMRSLLEGKYRVTKKAPSWNSLKDNEMLGKSGDFVLTKGEYLELYPDTENENFKIDFDLMDARLRNILEKEAFAQEVRKANCTNHPIFQRACVIASNLVRRDAFEERIQSGLPVGEEVVRAFWQKNRSLFKPLSLKRVTRLTLSPVTPAPLPSQTREEMEGIIAAVAGKTGGSTVQVKEREILDDERSDIIRDTESDTVQAFEFMREPMAMPTTEEGDKRTTEAHNIINESIPSDYDQPQGGRPTETESQDQDASSTDSLETLKEIIKEETTDSVSEKRGGAAPESVAGGGNIRELAQAAPKQNWVGGTSPVSTSPRSGNVPVGTTRPALPSGATVKEQPKELKHGKPPATSAVPYNPDWFYVRSKFSGVPDLVSGYKSSDWILKYEDLGFIYIEDHPEIPSKVDSMPAKSLSRPYMQNQTAVSYYVEEVRSGETPDFEAIKPYVYEVYRQTQIDKKLSDIYNSELKKADIRYDF